MKTTSEEDKLKDHLPGRQLRSRQSFKKTTTKEKGLIQRLACPASEFCTELGPAQRQLVLLYFAHLGGISKLKIIAGL